MALSEDLRRRVAPTVDEMLAAREVILDVLGDRGSHEDEFVSAAGAARDLRGGLT